MTQSTFKNIPHDVLVSILFVNNNFVTISKDSLSGCSRLQMVELSGYHVTVYQLGNVVRSLRTVPIKYLTISHAHLRCFPTGFFTPLANHTHLSLSLVNNRLHEYDGALFEPLKGLVYLNLRNNRITSMSMNEGYTQNVKRLRLDNNQLDLTPLFCSNNRSHFPQLEMLEIQFNHISSLARKNYDCLDKLKLLSLSGNPIRILRTDQFAGLSSLRSLSLSYVGCSLKKVYPGALNSATLSKLYFRKNYLQFGRDNNSIPFNIFGKCHSLKMLDINFNVLTFVRDDDYNAVFRNLSSLTNLIMGGCGLKYFPMAIPRYLKNLTSLSLYHNEIKDVPTLVENLTKLKYMNLRNCEITSVKEDSIPSSVMKHGILGLSENPFSCGCDSLWLITSLQNDPFTFRYNSYPKGYRCHSPLHLFNVSLMDVPISERTCLLSQRSSMIILVGLSLLITLLLVTTLLYYFRWNIMYLVFMLRYKQRDIVDREEWDYDAFVAYAIEDLGWVKESLMPVLEGRDMLKLCIHNRDFEVGNLIVDNIVNSVTKSRKVIIVLSNKFARSTWCQFELDLILNHVIETGQRILVVVMLEELDPRYVTKSMRVMMQTTTYLEWGEDREAKQRFYNRLRMLVNKPFIAPKSRRRKLSV